MFRSAGIFEMINPATTRDTTVMMVCWLSDFIVGK